MSGLVCFTHRSGRLVCACALLTSSLGCGIPLASGRAVLSNSCTGNDDCGQGGVCVNSMCVSTSADLALLRIEVTAPPDASYGAGTTSWIDLSEEGFALQGQRQTGYFSSEDLKTSVVVDFTGSLLMDPAPPSCDVANAGFVNGAVPINIEVRPVLDMLGVPITAYAASSSASNDNQVSSSVPAGRYDIYIQPAIAELNQGPNGQDINQACRDSIPPVILRDRDISSISVPAGAPWELNCTITGFDLDGWVMDMVDNAQGRGISTTETLGVQAATSPYEVALRFWPETIQSEGADPVVRLTPPDSQHGAGMPTVLWRLDSVDLDNDLSAQFDLSPLAQAEPLLFGGSVLDARAGHNTPIPATVVIQSEELLSGKLGKNYFFKTTIETDPNGEYQVSLLPGKYTFTVLPSSSNDMAITTWHWDIGSGDLGGGHTIPMQAKGILVGGVVTPLGNPAHDVSVFLQSSAAGAASFMQSMLTFTEPPPRSATTVVDEAGGFAIDLDPGEIDVSVRPAEETGLPWLVRPRLTMQSNDEPAKSDLGQLTLSNPVVLEGRVLSPHGEVLPGAQIRAWLPLPDTNSATAGLPAAIVVGATTADGNGAYRLLLPASLSQ